MGQIIHSGNRPLPRIAIRPLVNQTPAQQAATGPTNMGFQNSIVGRIANVRGSGGCGCGK